MAKQTINIGTVANDGTGDPLRTAFDKANDNFDELYTADAALVSADAAHDAIDTDHETRISALEAAPDSGIEEAPADGTGYVRKDGAWAAETTGGGSATTLDDLTDVDLTGAADGDVLTRSGGVWVAEAAAGGSGSSFRGALVTKAATQTGVNLTASADITFDSEGRDTDGFHDNSVNPARLTVPSGVSKVRLRAMVELSGVTAGNDVLARIGKNGAFRTLGDARGYANMTFFTTPSINLQTAVMDVTPGDYFTVSVQVESDTAVDIIATGTWFEIEVIE